MKLHKNIRRRANIRRALGIILALSMVVSTGATPLAAGTPDGGEHQHTGDCYGKAYVGEMGEHDGDCRQDQLICTLEESDDHVHGAECYGEVFTDDCEMAEHGEACYKYALTCGYAEDAGLSRASVSGGDGNSAQESPEGDRNENVSGNPEDENPAQGDDGLDAGHGADDSEGSGSEADGTQNGENMDAEAGDENGTDEKPEEGSADGTESEEGADTAEKPEEDGNTQGEETGTGSVSSGDAAGSLPFEGYDDSLWAINCHIEEAGHVHTRECYREIYCGSKAHTHGTECRNEEGEIVCEMEEHTHDAMCFASPAEIELLETAKEMIAALPSQEEIGAVMEQYEAGEMDEDQYGDYLLALLAQVREAYQAYLDVDEELRRYVENEDYLLALAELLNTMTLEEAGSVWDELTSDDAYVDKIAITQIVDGTAPFDHRQHTAECYNGEGELICNRTEYGADELGDRPGDDTSADNLIVRTFDSVNYKFSVDMKTYATNKAYKYARIKLEFVLPLSRDEAEFDLAAMSWMDTTEGYEPVVTEEVRRLKVGDKEEEVNCQVLTCYKYLMPKEGNQSVVPGKFGDNVTINIKSMSQGDKFAPIVSAAMEHGFWGDKDSDGNSVEIGAWTDGSQDEGGYCVNGYWGQEATCPAQGHGIEKKSVRAKEVTVSAAPKYNIQVRGDGSYTSLFDFNTGSDNAANIGLGTIYGRAMKLGVTLQLYNDNRSKGLKGIELPDTSKPIEFDLQLGSRYGNEGRYDTNEDYRPLLWSYGYSGAGNYEAPIDNGDGRAILETNRTAGLAPNGGGGGETGCDNSGTWTVTQKGSTIHVVVSGYTVNIDNMPKRNGDYGDILYGSDIGIGCFSAGQLWIVQPFNKVGEGSANEGPEFDIIKEPVKDGTGGTYGEGAFSTSAEAMNLKATTVGGKPYEDKEGTNSSQIVRDDDRYAGTLALTLPGALQNRVRYADLNQPMNSGAGIYDVRDGRDFATVGSKIRVMGGFTYHTNRVPDNQFYYATTLTKFYAEAMTPTLEGEDPIIIDKSGTKNLERVTVKAYYAAKKESFIKDGEVCWDWKDDKELQITYEDKLDFFESMEELEKTGKKCVGILYCFIGPGPTVEEEESNYPQYVAFHKMKVTEDMELAGKAYMLLSTTRLWTKGMFEKDPQWKDKVEGKDDAGILEVFENVIPTWNSPGHTTNFPSGYLASANFGNEWNYLDGYPTEHYWYVKETYAEDGSGIKGTHNSDWSHWGDTLLVIGYKTGVTKHLLQKSGNADKKVFNLDTNQRVVDFKLQPSVKYDNQHGLGDNKEITTTVQVVDILPQYLTYVKGSARYGFDGSSYVPTDGGNAGTVMNYIQTAPVGGRQGEIEGGEALEPEIKVVEEKQSDGTYVKYTTLTWTLENIIVGKDVPAIFYSATIGDKNNAKEDVPEGTTPLENKVYISSKYDLRDPSVENQKLAKEGITVTRGSASSFGKYTLQRVAERDGQIDYVVYYNNNAETSDWISFMDTMPADGIAGSAFKGSYELKRWKLDCSACEKEKLVIYYTTEDQYRNQTIQNLVPDPTDPGNPWNSIGLSPDGETIVAPEISGWTKAEVAPDGTISFSGSGETKAPVAWVVFGQLGNGQSVNIELQVQLHPSPEEEQQNRHDTYVNRISTGDNIVTTETPTVRRTLEGLTWLDYNRDGVQDQYDGAEELKIDGIRVELLKLKAGGDPQNENDYVVAHYIASDNEEVDEIASQLLGYRAGKKEAVIVTGQMVNLRDGIAAENPDGTGRYKFTELPPGTYGVRFTGGDEGDESRTEYAKAFHAWKATLKDVWSNANDEIDSDAEPVYGDEGARLEKTVILGIVMKDAEVMYEEKLLLQEEKHQDSGFYVESKLDIEKVDDKDAGKYLAGAKFAISALDPESNQVKGTLSFTGTPGSYSFLHETGKYGEGALYYIESVANSDLVLGVSHWGNGGVAQLQKKNSDLNGQLFEVFALENGAFVFRHVSSGRWLDLDSGNTKDENKVHIWDGDGNYPSRNPNHWWYVTQDREGNYLIQAYNAGGTRQAYLDIQWCNIAEGTTVFAFTKNDSPAQNWRLVPYSAGGQVQTLEVGATGDQTGRLHVENLVPGEYLITEMCAPLGYALLKEPLKIRVELDGRISVMNAQGAYGSAGQDGTLLKIENKQYQIYSLPSTGGSGTGAYAAAGFLAMAVSAAYFFLGGRRRAKAERRRA